MLYRLTRTAFVDGIALRTLVMRAAFRLAALMPAPDHASSLDATDPEFPARSKSLWRRLPYCVDGCCEECIQNTDCRDGRCNDDLECDGDSRLDAECNNADHPACDDGECRECVEDFHCPATRPFCVNRECRD